MPSVLESAKEAGYTALGLNVLFFDELAERSSDARKQWEERTADGRKQLDEQLDIAREHGRKAQANIKDAMPFDVDAVTDGLQDRVQPVAKKSFELAEPVWKRVAEVAPAPFDDYVTDGVERMREFLLTEEPAPAKKTTKKPAAKKTTKKASAKKASSKKAPASKAAKK